MERLQKLIDGMVTTIIKNTPPRVGILILTLGACLWLNPSTGIAQQPGETGASIAPGKLALGRVQMCEAINNSNCWNPAIVFSITIGRVSCYSDFDSVPRKMFIYHNWYHKDQLASKIKLTLKPPRWSTFSTIQFREADKGPWRVEIADRDNNIIQVIRFSVVD